MQNYCTGSNCDSVSSPLGEFFPLPPTPNSLDKLDNCFSDQESRCESEEFLDETASELEAVKPDQRVEQVDTAKLNTQLLVKPTRSFDAQIWSPSLPKRGSNTAMSSVFMMEPSLSRSEEHLWKKSKSTSAAVDKKHRYSSDALLEDDKRPPLPPRTSCLGQELPKIVSKPLPPIPIDEEEYVPNYEHRRKLSSSMDCLRNGISEEEPSPYIAPIELYNQLKQEQSGSLHLPDRPPLPAIPIEAPHRTAVSITRSKTQYIPGKNYGHKRSRSSNCDFLKSLQKDDKSHPHQLNSCATLNPSAFRSFYTRAKSNSPPESDLENSLKKNSFRIRSSKQSLVPDETDLDSFGTYTRMSPAPSIDVTSPAGQSEELLRDSNKLPTDNSSDTDLTECAAAVPPRRGERRKARRWENSTSKSNCNSASRHYWQQRQPQPFEVPRYVSQPSIQGDSHIIPINIRHDTQSKRSSRDSNIYEHVDEDVLEGLRKDREDGYRSSAETDTVYRSVFQQPGMFPHPPTAQEWHYFMYMWRLFLQWMTEHAPPEVYSVPSNVPANMNNTPPLVDNQAYPEYYDEVRKQSTTSYTSINCDWIRNLANARTSSLAEDSARASGGAFSPQESSDSTEANTVVDKHSTSQSQNSHATLNGNGKSVSSFDSGICHNSHNDDSNSNGDS